MAKLSAQELELLIASVDESKLSDEMKAVVEAQKKDIAESKAEAERMKKRSLLIDGIKANIVNWRSGVELLKLPSSVESLALSFTLDTESLKWTSKDVSVKLTGDTIHEKTLLDYYSFTETFIAGCSKAIQGKWKDEHILTAEQRQNINGQCQYYDPALQSSIQDIMLESRAEHFLDGVDTKLVSKEKSASVNAVYTKHSPDDETPDWKFDIRFGSARSVKRTNGNGKRVSVPGFANNTEYALSIADKKLKKAIASHTDPAGNLIPGKINMKQHIERIEATLPESKQLYRIAKEAKERESKITTAEQDSK